MPYRVERNRRKHTQATEGEIKIHPFRTLRSVFYVFRRTSCCSKPDAEGYVPCVDRDKVPLATFLSARGSTEQGFVFLHAASKVLLTSVFSYKRDATIKANRNQLLAITKNNC